MWEEYCARQAYTTTLEYFIEEYGEAEGIKKYNEFNAARKHVLEVDSSKMELDCIKWATQYIPELSSLEPQGSIPGVNGKVDFVCHERKKIIEFYGTHWHADKSRYAADSRVGNHSAQEIWDRDAHKIKSANAAGYSVFVIWQREYERKHLHVDLIKRLMEWWDTPTTELLNPVAPVEEQCIQLTSQAQVESLIEF